MIHLSDKTEWLLLTSAIAVATVVFLGYYYRSTSDKVNRLLKIELGNPINVLYQRFMGVIILGFLPLTIIFLSGTKNIINFGIDWPDLASYFYTMIF